jgi:thymidine phosphorylase
VFHDANPTPRRNALRMRRLGIDTHQEAVVYMREDCPVCRSEGLGGHARVILTHGSTTIIATLHHVSGEFLGLGEAGLSEAAWDAVGGRDGDIMSVSHPPPVDSLNHVRAKTFGQHLDAAALRAVITDIAARRYGNIHLASFITACAGGHLDREEMAGLTRAMIEVGERIDWGWTPIADKHSIGGLDGNRTSPIVAACGFTIPKTSSRAITSPSGTADTMETQIRSISI